MKVRFEVYWALTHYWKRYGTAVRLMQTSPRWSLL